MVVGRKLVPPQPQPQPLFQEDILHMVKILLSNFWDPWQSMSKGREGCRKNRRSPAEESPAFSQLCSRRKCGAINPLKGIGILRRRRRLVLLGLGSFVRLLQAAGHLRLPRGLETGLLGGLFLGLPGSLDPLSAFRRSRTSGGWKTSWKSSADMVSNSRRYWAVRSRRPCSGRESPGSGHRRCPEWL